ncbi:MAG: DNA repair protein RecO [Prevotella sp.]|nr:DNA repair protein RecO [Prevotella sp.]
MILKNNAIVLKTIKFGENRLIVDLLTELQGRLSFIANIPKTSRSKIKKQYFQPLSVLEIEFDYRPNQHLQRLKDARMATAYATVGTDARKLSIMLFMAEFIYHATREEQPDCRLFDYIKNSLLWLDACKRGFANFHLVFMMRLTRLLGFYPNLHQHTEDCFFDLRNACFTPTPPLHAEFLHPEEASKIKLLMRMNFETMHLFAMSHTERNRICDVLISFYRLHVPNFPKMNSLPILQVLH